MAFHAVDIASDAPVCESARSLENVRFLSRDVPPALPLAGCDRSADCHCRYRHHADRREGSRRHGEQVWASQQAWPSERERRRTGGRRITDR